MLLSLNNVLEQYAFSVAAKYVALVDAEQQSEIVELVGRLGASSSGCIDPEQSDDSSIDSSDSCLSELQQEWAEALKKSIG